jgi:single-strand DNA-binding protein
MAGSLNKVIIIGNLGQDPEVRDFANGGKVCNLRLATSETWKDKNSGERRERTEWHTVAIFSEGLVNVCQSYLKKGSKIYIEGQLETRKWQDQNGVDKYTTEVVLRPYRSELIMLDGRNGGNSGGAGSDENKTGASSKAPAGKASQDSSDGTGDSNGYDDEIPF